MSRSRDGLGRGHGMALVHVITEGSQVPGTHVGTTGVHRDATGTLDLRGLARRGEPLEG